MAKKLKKEKREQEQFWNSLLTEKSWQVLQELKKSGVKFILIGGWAAWLWARTLKSKDIDIVVESFEALEQLKKKFDLIKNNQLQKYEIKQGEIDIDVYAVYYSKLTIPIEELKAHTTLIEGFAVPRPEALLILKQAAELARGSSVKGEKDRLDILSLLLNTHINFREYHSLLDEYQPKNKKEFFVRLRAIITQCREYENLGINQRQYKIRREKLLKELQAA